MFKLIILNVFSLFLVGCLGVMDPVPDPRGTDGQPCTVSKAEGITTISCPDGTSSTISDGSKGPEGQGCSVTQVPVGDSVLPYGGAVIICNDNSVLISNGAKGDTGEKGSDGINGRDGVDSQPSAYGIEAIIDPCGDSPSIDDEVFLKLANGTILWLQVDNSNGKNARLAVARPGRWQTTDGSDCQFTLNTDGSITGESFNY